MKVSAGLSPEMSSMVLDTLRQVVGRELSDHRIMEMDEQDAFPTDLIRKLRGEEAFGLTLPLVCDRSGQKFGKSAGNAIYLDAAKTPVFDFYQFFVRVDDADVIRFLKVFTFLSAGDLADYERRLAEAPEKREAQIRLAEEVTRRVHGEAGLQVAQRSTAVLFGAAMDGLKADELEAVFADVPSTALPSASVIGAPVATVAVESGFCKSRGEARRLVENGGFYVNNQRLADAEHVLCDADIIDGRLLVLRSGKKRYHLVRVGQNG